MGLWASHGAVGPLDLLIVLLWDVWKFNTNVSKFIYYVYIETPLTKAKIGVGPYSLLGRKLRNLQVNKS